MSPLQQLASQAYIPAMGSIETICQNDALVTLIDQVAKSCLQEDATQVRRLPAPLRQVLLDRMLQIGIERAKPFLDEEVSAALLGKYKTELARELLEVQENSISLHNSYLSDEQIQELLSSVQNPESVTDIDLGGCRNLVSLRFLNRFSHITSLILKKTGIHDLTEAGKCKALTSLDVSDCHQLTTLNGIPAGLKTLNTEGCSKLRDISALRNAKVVSANLSHCRDIKDFDPLKDLADCLEKLTITGCPKFSNKEILNCLNLKSFSFDGSGVMK